MTFPTTAPAGSIAFVAYGPGDPGLISVAGVREVTSAEVLVVDELAMIEQLASVDIEPQGEVVLVEDDEVAQLIGLAGTGRFVVRLSADDFLSDRRHGAIVERVLAESNFRAHLVPGVGTWSAVMTYAGIVPTGVTAAFDACCSVPEEWPNARIIIIRTSDEKLQDVIAAGKERFGASAEVFQITCLATTAQRARLSTWSTVDVTPCNGYRYLLVGPDIGEAVRARVDWFESKPLFDWSVLVPRTKDEPKELLDHLARFGATSEVVATMSIEPPRTENAMEKAVRGIVDGRYLWLVFTSPHSVAAIIERLAEYGLDSRAMAGIHLAAVGRGTVEALAKVGIRPDLVPLEGSTAHDLALEFPAHDDLIDPLNRVLIPTADVSVADLVEGLTNLGWEIEEVTAYRTVRAAPPPAEVRERIKTGMFDAVVFTSSSAVRNMIGIAGKPHAASVIAAIGPATAEACRMHGLRVDVTSDSPSYEALVDGLARFADHRRQERIAQGLPDTKPSQRRRRRRKDAPAKES